MMYLDKGIYGLLPLGQRIIDKLQAIIETELLNIGAQKLDFPLLASKNLWMTNKRWDLLGHELYRLSDRVQNDYCLQPTAEEMVTKMVKDFGVLKKRQYPLMLFQFRDELAPRHGLLRTNQFIMNDLYTFDKTESDAKITYETITSIYKKILMEILGLPSVYFLNAPTGEIGGTSSHEFHLPNQSDENKIIICLDCKTAMLVENISENPKCLNCSSTNYTTNGTVEIAHTFNLSTKYSSVFSATSDETNKEPYHMGCFGIGLTRLMAASIDALSTSEKAMRLPYLLNPFKLAIVLPKRGADDPNWEFLQSVLPNLKSDIFVDDRIEKSVGKRLAELNQIGTPTILVINTMKSESSYTAPKFELFRTKILNDELVEASEKITHAQVLELCKSL